MVFKGVFFGILLEKKIEGFNAGDVVFQAHSKEKMWILFRKKKPGGAARGGGSVSGVLAGGNHAASSFGLGPPPNLGGE